MNRFDIKEKSKIIVFLLLFLIVTPLTVFYILDGGGIFDTRGRAGFVWEECEYSKADLNVDGKVNMTDFGIWLRDYTDIKDNPGSYIARADLTGSNSVVMSDFALWLRLWRQYKACQEGLSREDSSMCLAGCIPVDDSQGPLPSQLPQQPPTQTQPPTQPQAPQQPPTQTQPPTQPQQPSEPPLPPPPPTVTSPHCNHCSAAYSYVKANFDIKGWSSTSSYPTENECRKASEDGTLEKLYYTCAYSQCSAAPTYQNPDPNDTYPGYVKTGPWAPYKGILTESQYSACYGRTPPSGDCACDPDDLKAVSCPLINHNGRWLTGHEHYELTYDPIENEGIVEEREPYYEGGCPEGFVTNTNRTAVTQENPNIPNGIWWPGCYNQNSEGQSCEGDPGLCWWWNGSVHCPIECHFCTSPDNLH